MSRPARRARPFYPEPKVRRDSERDIPLDNAAREAIQFFARALARRGASPSAMAEAFAAACTGIPRQLIERAKRAGRELSDASHVLSLWFTDPQYLDAAGKPLALPPEGNGQSIATLVARVDPALDAKTVLRYLLRMRALAKIGARYGPRRRALDFRGTGGPTHSRGFRMVLALLRTLEHNTRPENEAPGSFEYSAENPRFPRSAREDFGAKVRQGGLAYLSELDSAMLSYERNRDPGEPTVRMGVGIYLYEDESEPKRPEGEPRKSNGPASARVKNRKNR